MATKDLINLTHFLGATRASPARTRSLGVLITAYSEAVEKYCRRRFVTGSYDELYDGNGERRLLLRQYPIQSVQAVRYRPVTVLKITNTIAANVQARVSVLSTGLQLVSVSAGVKTTVTSGLTFAGNVTLSALAAAVNAVGNDLEQPRSWATAPIAVVGRGADLYVPSSYGDTLEGAGVLQSRRALQGVARLVRRAEDAHLRAARLSVGRARLAAQGHPVYRSGAAPSRGPGVSGGHQQLPHPVHGRLCDHSRSGAGGDGALGGLRLQPGQRTIRRLLHQVPASGTTSGWGPVTSGRSSPPADVRALLAPYRRYLIGTNQS